MFQQASAKDLDGGRPRGVHSTGQRSGKRRRPATVLKFYRRVRPGAPNCAVCDSLSPAAPLGRPMREIAARSCRGRPMIPTGLTVLVPPSWQPSVRRSPCGPGFRARVFRCDRHRPPSCVWLSRGRAVPRGCWCLPYSAPTPVQLLRRLAARSSTMPSCRPVERVGAVDSPTAAVARWSISGIMRPAVLGTAIPTARSGRRNSGSTRRIGGGGPDRAWWPRRIWRPSRP